MSEDPAPLPPSIDPREFSPAVAKARSALAGLDQFLDKIAKPLHLLSFMVLKESIASSKIESIHAPLEDLLKGLLCPQEIKDRDIISVLQYRDALITGFEQMQRIPISSRLILKIHQRLLPSLGGGYRQHQNLIADAVTGEVRYTPPKSERIPELLAQWERFVHESIPMDPLLKAALAHYQFEAIHPFSDGNGRCGRILVLLQLVSDKVLKWPLLYLSGYIQERSQEYCDNLRQINAKNNWTPFLEFMLEAFYIQAKKTEKMGSEILDSLKKTGPVLQEILAEHPIITPEFLEKNHILKAKDELRNLTAHGVLVQEGAYPSCFFRMQYCF